MSTRFAYRSALARNGFTLVESFFSPFSDERLRARHVRDVRFAPLARAASLAWNDARTRGLLKRYGLLLGQATIGLQLNVIARKRHRNRPEADKSFRGSASDG